jgi:hypothetical protein
MLTPDIRSTLIECLNTNIKLEESYNSRSIKGLPYEWISLMENPSGSTSSSASSGAPGGGAGSGGAGGGSTSGGSPGSGSTGSFGTSGTSGTTYVPAGAPGGGACGATVGFTDKDLMKNGGNSVLNMLLGGHSDLLSLQNAVGGLAGAISVGGIAMGMNKLTGKDWVLNQMQQIAKNQEELRGEGLGYTKGWAKLKFGNP